MKQTKIIMGMPITIEVVDEVNSQIVDSVFDYFKQVDRRFSTYKPKSEISKINGGLSKSEWSREMKLILGLAEQTKRQTSGYFDIYHNGKLDPSGLVKGWAVFNAAKMLQQEGFTNFYIEAGGDTQVSGPKPWTIGIRNPFNINQIVKVVSLTNQGLATSGTYIRGQHIYNPHQSDQEITDIKSLTVVAKNVYEADRFATAAFAMGRQGIEFIEKKSGLEGYMIDADQIATFTSGFESYVAGNV